jgi:hypothetical protein
MPPQFTPGVAAMLFPVPRIWRYLEAGAEILTEKRNRNYRADSMNAIRG